MGSWTKLCRYSLEQENTAVGQSLSQIAESVTFHAGEMITVKNQSEDYVYLLAGSAVVKQFVDTDGREYISGFISEPGSLLFTGLIMKPGMPARLSLQALTRTELIRIELAKLATASEEQPQLAAWFYQKNAVQERLFAEARTEMKMCSGVGEKYDWFLRRFHRIADAISTQDIAIYLDVKEQNLCKLQENRGRFFSIAHVCEMNQIRNPETVAKITAAAELIIFRKGDVLIRNEKKDCYIYVVVAGCLRSYYPDVNVTTAFYSDDLQPFYLANTSGAGAGLLLGHYPAQGNLEAVTNGYLYRFRIQDVESLVLCSAEMRNYWVRCWKVISKRHQDFQVIGRSPSVLLADRYQWFLENYAPIADVENKYIASFLGATEQSLSRVKAQLLAEKPKARQGEKTGIPPTEAPGE